MENYGSSYARDDVLNANDFFAKRNGQPRPVLKQNQFGFTIGGPIRKNKTFFFGAYQGTTQRNGDSSLSLVTAILPQLTNDRPANGYLNPEAFTSAPGFRCEV